MPVNGVNTPTDKMDGPGTPRVRGWQLFNKRYHERVEERAFCRSEQRVLRTFGAMCALACTGVFIWFCAQYPARRPIYAIGLAACLLATLMDIYEIVKLDRRRKANRQRLHRVNPVATLADTVVLVLGIVCFVLIKKTNWWDKEHPILEAENSWKHIASYSTEAEVVTALSLVIGLIHGVFVLLAVVAACLIARHPKAKKQQAVKEQPTSPAMSEV